MMNNEIIQLKTQLRKRSQDYLKNKKNGTGYVQVEGVEAAIDNVFNDVIGKVSKRNLEALGKVDFSVGGGLKNIPI
jgi:hypothetical protein